MAELEQVDWLRTGAFFAGSLAIVAFGKLVRDAISLLRGHRLSHAIVAEDNTAVAVELSAFVLAVVVALLGSIVVTSDDPLIQAADLAVTGMLVIGWLLINGWLTAKVVLHGLNPWKEVVENGNLAVAIPRAASNLATALVVRAALGHESAFLDRLGWVAIGQVALLGIAVLYQKLTRYDDIAELKKANTACAWPLAGILLAVGLVVEAALRGQGQGWAADLQSVGLDLGLSLVLLAVLRWLADLLLLPKARLHDEIVHDRNTGAGVIEATAYVSGAFTIAFFLT